MKIKTEDRQALQILMHYYGIDNFKKLLAETAQACSEETEDVNIKISEKWMEFCYEIEGLNP